MIESLSSPEEPVRYRAVLELSKAESSISKSALDGLRTRLDDPSPRIRIAAARGLSASTGEGIVSDLTRLADDESPEVRRAAVEGLVRAGGESAIDVLLERLLDREPEIREFTRQALVELGISGRDQIIRRAMRQRDTVAKQAASAEWSRRLQAAQDLARCGDEEAVEVLLELVDDGELDVARTAGHGIGRAFSNVAPQKLIAVLDSPSSSVVVEVLKGMSEAPREGEIDEEAATKLCSLLLNKNKSRIAAKVVTHHEIRCDFTGLEHQFAESEGREKLDTAVTITLLAKAPEAPRRLVEHASELVWRSARGFDLTAVAALGEPVSGTAEARVEEEIRRYLSMSERWIQPPSTERESGEDETSQDDDPSSNMNSAEALRSLLSQYPSRRFGWVELFPSAYLVEDLVTMLVVSGDVSVHVDDDLVEALIASAPDPQVRAAAVWVRGGGVSYLQSEHPQIRAVSAEALRRRAPALDGQTKARLSFVLADHDASVRVAAATTLALTRDPAALHPLLAAMRRWHEPELAHALGELGQNDAAETLAGLISSATHRSNSELVEAVLDALALVGSTDNAEAIVPFMSDPRPEVRSAATRAARAIGGSRLEQLADERRGDFALIVREAASLTSE